MKMHFRKTRKRERFLERARFSSTPVVPEVPADEAARELADAGERESVSVSVSSESYDSAYGPDDLDIPDFLK